MSLLTWVESFCYLVHKWLSVVCMDALTYTLSCLCICVGWKDVYERTYASMVGDLCFLFLLSKSSGAEPVNATQSNMSSHPIGWATKRESKLKSIIPSSSKFQISELLKILLSEIYICLYSLWVFSPCSFSIEMIVTL